MPVWSGLPDKKNPVEGQRGLPHPFVILKIKIYTNISVLQGKIQLFLRGDKTQNFFFTLKPLYTYELTLSGPPPPYLPFGLSWWTPPRLYPSFAPTQWAPPLYPPFGLTQWTPHCTVPLDSPSKPPTIPSLWTHPVNPPLYPSFELPHWTPHYTVPLDSLSGAEGVLTPRDFHYLEILVLRWVFLMKIFVIVKLMMGQIGFPVSFILMRTSAHTFLHVIVYM